MAKNVDTAEKVVRYLIARGWTAGRVDRQLGRRHKEDWPGHGVGFADVIAFHPDQVPHWVLIQSCTTSHRAEHLRTLDKCQYVLRRAAKCGAVAELWCWKDDEPHREIIAAPETWPKTGGRDAQHRSDDGAAGS
jgi:hypothetical protein